MRYDHQIVASVGVFTHAEYVEHISHLRQEVIFRPEFDQIVDCRLITEMNFTSDQTAELASMSIFARTSRRVFIAPSNLHFGLSRMLTKYLELKKGQETMVFRGMREGLSWLNLPLDIDPFVPREPKDDTNIT